MRPEDVPDEWVEAAFKAARVGSDALAPGWMQRALAAVAPLIAAAERERVVLVLEAAAERVAPTGKRSNHIDRHVADVLRDKAAAIRAMGDATDTAPAPTRNAAHL